MLIVGGDTFSIMHSYLQLYIEALDATLQFSESRGRLYRPKHTVLLLFKDLRTYTDLGLGNHRKIPQP